MQPSLCCVFLRRLDQFVLEFVGNTVPLTTFTPANPAFTPLLESSLLIVVVDTKWSMPSF